MVHYSVAVSRTHDELIRASAVGAPGGTRTVFFHGLLGQGRNFNQVAKVLQPDLHSLLVDLPNHGRSAWMPSVDYCDVADVLANYLRTGFAREQPVDVVGHSMGGKVAMVLALRHPELVDRLVVVDIAPTVSSETAEFEHLLGSLLRLDLSLLERRADADRLLKEAIPDDRVRGFLLQNLRADGSGFSWQANLVVLHAGLATLAGFPSPTILGAAASHHPVLWIAGSRSDHIRPEHDAVMRGLFPRTQAVEIEGAGHWVHSDQPSAFASDLKGFLMR